MEIFSEYISIILTTVIQFLVAIGGICLIRVIVQFAKKLGINIDQDMMDDIEDIVFKAVCVTNQTIADIWRETNEDHRLTNEQQEEAFANTKAIIMAALSGKQLQLLAAKYGVDAEEAVDLLIEHSVYWNGKENQLVVSETVGEIETGVTEE